MPMYQASVHGGGISHTGDNAKGVQNPVLEFLRFLTFVFVIVQQPPDNTLWVSPDPANVTQYARVPDGNIGLLAEENEAFLRLAVGDTVILETADGVKLYRVSSVMMVTAENPYSVHSTFIDGDGNRYSSEQLGNMIYAGSPKRLVLQTCYNGANGRIFITALPIREGRERHKEFVVK